MPRQFFLVRLCCITQPIEYFVLFAVTSYYDTEESCILAANNFDKFMKSKDSTHMTTMNCVAAYPIPEDKVSTYF